ncbi:1-deoxy-D-xylulose-5-phosphate synthase [uncultured Oscillibacter sp.]|jgi:1-deoxy-D-xylulose-5-phosphate synthase|uniref:1-deoxy-D-xylulose-5-phosphate synthase n=1 Tax=uncultured Oscillibacter sp. TaxID=876091 RepID=UPI0021745336|nr:1-deoxy-D-xylulose-5-phosphate synthase [uncultured Oscillibacter sp.]MCI9553984.1 1-deoxy-D-xylulose-5-phosphate synthase [Oscillibacter sp.]
MLLDSIHSPADVRALPEGQLPQLCHELREFLVKSVSQTGGHLASNLGAVELTVAIHRIFDTERDRLVFDVGHQCYVHKILTGRRERFDTLRRLDGLSGFPKPRESVHDAFIAGHASNSVSVALGMARARTLTGMDHSVLALIGDGALTGGLAYEGLNNAGASGEPLIVILNDNGMSIDPNVGAMPSHLARLRSRPAYYHFKKWYRSLFGSRPMGNPLYRFNHQVKTSLKKTLFPGSTLFEDMGFTYLGPVDGHDLSRLCDTLSWARELDCPVVVHVHTIKGKGVSFAERNPDMYHGVGPFDPETGLLNKTGEETFSTVFGRALTDFAREDARVCAVTAAMADGTGLSGFAKTFPDRFFDVGIAEGHGVSMAAGMAAQGLLPVFAVYSTFLQRSYDMLIHDVALEKLHVILGVDRAGLVGADGETHHGCFDPLFLPALPGYTVLCPASFAELRQMLRTALFELDGPVAVRYPRGGEGAYQDNVSDKPLVRLRAGKDVTLLTYGILVNQALAAAALLEGRGIQAEVLKLNRIAPLDGEALAGFFEETDILLVLEDCFGAGCVGQRVAAILTGEGRAPKRLILRNLGRSFAPEGSVPQLEERFGLDAAAVAGAAEEACHER